MTSAQSARFGRELKRLRLAAGLTQEALAERAGISARAVSDLERDPTRTPRLETVTLLAEALALDEENRSLLLAAARPHPESTPFRGPDSVPVVLTPLVGRDRDVMAVVDLLRDDGVRLVTLTGPGGVGKTRLAIETVQQVVDALPDDAVFVDLAPLRNPHLLLSTIVQQLGVHEHAGIPLEQSLVDALREKRLLLLLDNFEHLLPAREMVLRIIAACPRLLVLITSRVALRVRGERIYPVKPLPISGQSAGLGSPEGSPAVQLFADRARAAGSDLTLTPLTVPIVEDICRRLDGLPLAIELAAAWTTILPPQLLLERLAVRLPLLIGGLSDLPARQQTMRDTIAWSYDLLDAAEQRLFRRLSVFVGGCTVEAAEDVCAGPEGERTVLQLLAALATKSLMTAPGAAGGGGPNNDARLTMLETVREFAHEQLGASGEAEAIRTRHAAWYTALAESTAPELAGADATMWSARLDREHDNVRAALRHSLAMGDAATALRLAGSLWPYWSARGYLSEGRQWLDEALEREDTAHGAVPALRLQALTGAAMLAIDQAAFGPATELTARSVAEARELGNRRSLVHALTAQGTLARQQGRFAEAEQSFTEVLALAREAKDRTVEADALIALGITQALTGDTAGAAILYEESLTIFRVLGNRRGQAEALLSLARRSENVGDYAQVEALGEDALTLFRTLGDTGKTAETLFTLATVAQYQGRDDRAETLLEESIDLREQRGDTRGVAVSRSGLGRIALRRGDKERARRLLEDAVETARRFDDRWGLAIQLTLLGHVELASGNARGAAALFSESITLHHALGSMMYAPWCLEGAAGVAASYGLWVQAAHVCGARDAMLTRLDSSLPPIHPAAFDDTVRAAREALGEDVFEREHAIGKTLSPKEAVDQACINFLDRRP